VHGNMGAALLSHPEQAQSILRAIVEYVSACETASDADQSRADV
jgi:tRNA-dihydrouridine synthase